jgi:histone H3/H4
MKKTISTRSKAQSNIIKAINEAIEEFVSSMEGKIISNI